MGTFACDVSYYQLPVDDSYPHPWLIYRACDGTFRDPNFRANNTWARRAAASGRLKGHTVYVVYRPGVDVLAVLKEMGGPPDPFLTVMIDVESWGGQVSGNHSAGITALAERFAAWLGSRQRVLAYGNRGDLASIYPNRPPWLRLIVASYGSVKPSVPGMIGWQYSDGAEQYPVPAGWRRASAPFGPCDHNYFDLSPSELAAALGIGEDDVSAADVWNYPLRNPDSGAALSAAERLLDAENQVAELRKEVAAVRAEQARQIRLVVDGDAEHQPNNSQKTAAGILRTLQDGVANLAAAVQQLQRQVESIPKAPAGLPAKFVGSVELTGQ